MNLNVIEAGLWALEHDARLWPDAGLARRWRALDFLTGAAPFINNSDADPSGPLASLATLAARVGALRAQLSAVDEALFRRLRAPIQAGAWQPDALRAELIARTSYQPGSPGAVYYGLDELDYLVDGLLDLPAPAATQTGGPEMLPYEPTPARAIFDFAARAGLTEADVFYDIGSGLGRLALLVHLISGAPARGLERDPALCALARETAGRLGLKQVECIQADAREADYAGGTVFYMFTPFRGSIFRAVLGRLRERAAAGPFRLGTFGACSARFRFPNRAWKAVYSGSWCSMSRIWGSKTRWNSSKKSPAISYCTGHCQSNSFIQPRNWMRWWRPIPPT
jgi:hypothetical protein